MEGLLASGKTKAIGVSNYSVKYLKALLAEAKVVPAVNQIENHPSLPQQDVVDFCREKGILITAYSPLGSTGGPMFKEPKIQEVAKRRGVTEASVLLSYHRKFQRMFRTSPKTNLHSGTRQFGPRQVGYTGAHQGK